MSRVTDFEAMLDAVNTAIDSEDWATARKNLVKARVLHAKIPIESQSSQQRNRYRNILSDLQDALSDLAASASRVTDLKRLGRTRVNYPR